MNSSRIAAPSDEALVPQIPIASCTCPDSLEGSCVFQGIDILTRLSISLLGCFDVLLEGKRITAFKADKARALLSYLVIEAGRPHHRASLATLLWPDYPETKARNNLRQTIYRVRQALADVDATHPHILISNRDIQFNAESDYWLDADEFRKRSSAFLHLCSQGRIPSDAYLEEMEAAINLYHGDFLTGFSIANTPQFEGWLLSYQESFHHLALDVLTQLAEHFERRRKFTTAIKYAKRSIELEPWFEASHRRLIHLLALSGQRHAALRQFEKCRRNLAREMSVEPSPETILLFECIRDRTLHNVEGKGHLLNDQKSTVLTLPSGDTPCVARERELAQLHCHLNTALAGQGHLAFVRGETGSGKTTLMGEFARQAMREHENILVAVGNCVSLANHGCSYLPFLETLRMLSGNEECIRLSGLTCQIASRRLMSAFPDVLQVLIESGPDLLGTLNPGEALLKRALKYPGTGEVYLRQLKERLRPGLPPKSWNPSHAGMGDGQLAGNCSMANSFEGSRIDLHDQIAQVIIALSRCWPLLLILDDMQWVDQGSINLLFQLVRQISCSPILILGAYRPEEIVRVREDERHPLEQVIHELKRRIGDAEVDLAEADGRNFINAFLDTEPNRLSETFRQTLYQHTEGQPLFTVELLRVMQESSDLVHDDQGFWVSSPSLDWERLPPRVDAVIAERVSRVSDFSRDILSAASVQGVTFSMEVVAKVIGAHESLVAGRLSGELSKQHKLVRALGVQSLGDLHLSRFQFKHRLHQIYLYKNLDNVERARLQHLTNEVLDEITREYANETSIPEAGDSILA